MKKIFVTSLFLTVSFWSLAQYTQIPSGKFTGFPYTLSQDSGLNPSLCDTMKYVFRLITDSYSRSFVADSGAHHSDSKSMSHIYSVNRIDSLNDNITGSPFAYAINYQSGNDSVWMFKVFTDVIEKVKECLLSGVAKETDGFLSRDPENGRKLRYEYVIKQVKEGIDPKLNNAIITIEFYPDTRDVENDNFVLYRVDLVIHP